MAITVSSTSITYNDGTVQTTAPGGGGSISQSSVVNLAGLTTSTTNVPSGKDTRITIIFSNINFPSTVTPAIRVNGLGAGSYRIARSYIAAWVTDFIPIVASSTTAASTYFLSGRIVLSPAGTYTVIYGATARTENITINCGLFTGSVGAIVSSVTFTTTAGSVAYNSGQYSLIYG